MSELKILFMWLMAILIDVLFLSLLIISLRKIFTQSITDAIKWFIGNSFIIMVMGIISWLVTVYIFEGTREELVEFYKQHIKILLSMIK